MRAECRVKRNENMNFVARPFCYTNSTQVSSSARVPIKTYSLFARSHHPHCILASLLFFFSLFNFESNFCVLVVLFFFRFAQQKTYEHQARERFYYGVNYGAHIAHKSVSLAKLSFNAYKNRSKLSANLFSSCLFSLYIISYEICRGIFFFLSAVALFFDTYFVFFSISLDLNCRCAYRLPTNTKHTCFAQFSVCDIVYVR